MPRGAGRQQNRDNPDVQTVSDFYRVTLYNVFLDHLVQEMETRTLGNEDRYCAQHLLPSKLTGLRDDILPTIYAPTFLKHTRHSSRKLLDGELDGV